MYKHYSQTSMFGIAFAGVGALCGAAWAVADGGLYGFKPKFSDFQTRDEWLTEATKEYKNCRLEQEVDDLDPNQRSKIVESVPVSYVIRHLANLNLANTQIGMALAVMEESTVSITKALQPQVERRLWESDTNFPIMNAEGRERRVLRHKTELTQVNAETIAIQTTLECSQTARASYAGHMMWISSVGEPAVIAGVCGLVTAWAAKRFASAKLVRLMIEKKSATALHGARVAAVAMLPILPAIAVVGSLADQNRATHLLKAVAVAPHPDFPLHDDIGVITTIDVAEANNSSENINNNTTTDSNGTVAVTVSSLFIPKKYDQDLMRRLAESVGMHPPIPDAAAVISLPVLAIVVAAVPILVVSGALINIRVVAKVRQALGRVSKVEEMTAQMKPPPKLR